MNFLDFDINQLKPIADVDGIDHDIDTRQRECLKSTFLLKGNLCNTLKCIAINSGLTPGGSILETDMILMNKREDTLYTYINLPHGSRKTLSAMIQKFFLLEVSVVNDIKNFKVYATQFKAKYQRDTEIFFSVRNYYNGLLLLKDKTPQSQLSLMLNDGNFGELTEEENADDVKSEALSGNTSEYQFSDTEIDQITSKIAENDLDILFAKIKAKYQEKGKSKKSSTVNREKTKKKSSTLLKKRTVDVLSNSSFEPTARKTNSQPTEEKLPKKSLWQRFFGKN